KQQTILSFFKQPASSPASSSAPKVASDAAEPSLPKSTPFNKRTTVPQDTPAPSSDPVDIPTSPIAQREEAKRGKPESLPTTGRKRRTTTGISYVDSSDEEDEALVRP